MLADRVRMGSNKKRLDEFTKILLHMDGASGSTAFMDESGKIWTPYGNVKIDTQQHKFGGASAYFDGTGCYLSTPDSEDFNLGYGNFTFDFWIRLNITGAEQEVFGMYGFDGWAFMCTVNGYNRLQFSHCADGMSGASTYGTQLLPDTWYHIAIVRSGSNLHVYKDGIVTESLNISKIFNSASKFWIGRRGDDTQFNYFKGWIDEFRLSKSIARWKSDFTPPTEPY